MSGGMVCERCGSAEGVRRRVMYSRSRMFELKSPFYYERVCKKCRGKGVTLTLVVFILVVGAILWATWWALNLANQMSP
ncbi:MAG: hypothetical protein KDA31_08170 [Phycisphaerales bacterium]|nr:hypothetical protein [Phycisphaerales bacterium]MCB9835885.1 hypothetical protein [Phycisphaera sp.]